MRIDIDQITVGTGIDGSECLFVHADTDAAEAAIDGSPIDDGVSMCTTTYHRAARPADVRRLRYDRNGEMVTL